MGIYFLRATSTIFYPRPLSPSLPPSSSHLLRLPHILSTPLGFPLARRTRIRTQTLTSTKGSSRSLSINKRRVSAIAFPYLFSRLYRTLWSSRASTSVRVSHPPSLLPQLDRCFILAAPSISFPCFSAEVPSHPQLRPINDRKLHLTFDSPSPHS